MNKKQKEELNNRLIHHCIFAITHLRIDGGGMLVIGDHRSDDKLQTVHWKDCFADTLDMAGIKVDRELLHLTNAQRKQVLKKRAKAKAAIGGKEQNEKS